MNILKTLLTISTFFYFFSCSGPQADNKVEATEPAAPAEQPVDLPGNVVNYTIADEQSVIIWSGANKFTPKKHEGTLKVTRGKFSIVDNTLMSIEVEADMNSISSEGDEYTDGAAKVGNLIGHLKSEDFFEVETYPTAWYINTEVKPLMDNPDFSHELTGNLTIKGITKQITFPAKVTIEGESLKATANFTIDRSQWEVKYGSETFFPDLVKDRLIRNEIELKLNLAATAG